VKSASIDLIIGLIIELDMVIRKLFALYFVSMGLPSLLNSASLGEFFSMVKRRMDNYSVIPRS